MTNRKLVKTSQLINWSRKKIIPKRSETRSEYVFGICSDYSKSSSSKENWELWLALTDNKTDDRNFRKLKFNR